jgi:hypothetical protein
MSFNLDEFMNAAVDAPMATSYPVHPEGEFPFMLDADPKMLEVKHMSGVSAKTGNPYDFHQMELVALAQDDGVKAKMGRDKVAVRLRLNLDFDGNGRLAVGEGKNVILGQLRDALGQNVPGWTPKQLLGAGPFIGRVKHSSFNDRTYADIVAVAKYR